jgi:CheY-like chemotaxis protein
LAQLAPDLLISDVMMPGMTGVELAIHFRKAQPGCKVLLFSGQAATADLLEKAGGQGYEFDLLSKPVHPKDLPANFEFKRVGDVCRVPEIMGVSIYPNALANNLLLS